MKVAIVGAGVSGITLAYELSRHKNLTVEVFERDSESGGCIKTIEEDGYILESGPTGVLESRSHVYKLLESSGLLDKAAFSSLETKRRYLQKDGAIHRAPSNPVSAFTTPLMSFSGKMRILAEPFIKPDVKEDESVYDFAKRRIGEEAAHTLVSTLIGGIYAGDARVLSVRTAFPRLYNIEREYGSLLKGMLKKAKKEKSPRRRGYRLISTERGMKGFVSMFESVAAQVVFRYDSPLESIYSNSGGGYTLISRGESYHFDFAALCLPSFDAAPILSTIDYRFSEALSEVRYAPVFVCGLGYDEAQIAHPLDGFGYLVTPDDYKLVLGCLFSSTLFAGRAPKGKALLSAISVGERGKELISKSDEELTELILKEVSAVLGISGAPEKLMKFRTVKALPQYFLGHYKILEMAEHVQKKNKGLFIGGNSLYGVSVSDCIARSQSIAESILAQNRL